MLHPGYTVEPSSVTIRYMPNRVESLIAEIQGNMTRTYGHSVSLVLTECRNDMSAAVVELVSLKAVLRALRAISWKVSLYHITGIAESWTHDGVLDAELSL